MRYIILTFLIILLNLTLLSAQSCLQIGVRFFHQVDIDSFEVNYPNCTSIDGYVEISGNNIHNLNGLKNLKSVKSLRIYGANNLTNLSGLDSLSSIGRELIIETSDKLTSLNGLESLASIGSFLFIYYNNSLDNISGLRNLSHIGKDVLIQNNDSLTSLTGLESLTKLNGYLFILSNYALVSLRGLDNVTSIKSSLVIENNPVLPNLIGLNNLTTIDNYLGLHYNYELTSLQGLEKLTYLRTSLQVIRCHALTDFTGLSSLDFIGGQLYIYANFRLRSFSGLDNVTSVGMNLPGASILVEDNPALMSISSLGRVKSIQGGLLVINNDSLSSLIGFDSIDISTIRFISIENNSILSICNTRSICDYIVDPYAVVSIFGNAMGCSNPTAVEKACAVNVNTESPNDISISIYPNPSRSFITISTTFTGFIDQFYIYNDLGQLVKKQDGMNRTIDISNLPLGMYILELRFNGRSTSQKFILE